MCGYFGNLHESPVVIDLFNRLGIPLPLPLGQHYPMRLHPGLVSRGAGGYAVTQAIWWYALHWDAGQLVPNPKFTSFNARNLEGKMWRTPINRRRALVIATEIGETQGKTHYLMKSREAFALGALYQDYQTDAGVVRAFAVITRPATESFAGYHEKAMPLFLPLEKSFLNRWLDPDVPADHPQLQTWLEHPGLTSELEVTPVKTFKRAEPLGQSERLTP